MKKEISISTKRMLELYRDAVRDQIAENDKVFSIKIGLNYLNFSKFKKGELAFSAEHITEACKLLNINANWVLGIEENKYRKAEKDPLVMIKNALRVLEKQALKEKSKR